MWDEGRFTGSILEWGIEMGAIGSVREATRQAKQSRSY